MPGTSVGATLAAGDAFAADGVLRSALLEVPVAGHRLQAEGAGSPARFGDVLGAGDTLLIFLRHLG